MRSNLAVISELKQAGRSSAASASVQMRRASHPAFIDTRPEAIAQSKHQENAAASGRTNQLMAMSALMAGSAHSSRMRSLAELAGTGSTQTAQRKKLIDAQDAAQPLQRVVDDEPLQARFEAVQRAEDEELRQGKSDTTQRMEEEEPLQGKFDTVQRMEEDEPLQGKFEPAQRVEEEDLLQGQFAAPASTQLKEKPNNSGLPNQLKSGIESLSGISMDHVNVHYNSAGPAQLHAHAYAQGSEIHLAPGQERHLPHEAWHVVQQAQGRVKSTTQMKGNTPVNDDVGLEAEADLMGEKALGVGMQARAAQRAPANLTSSHSARFGTAQLKVSALITDHGTKYVSDYPEAKGKLFDTRDDARQAENIIREMRGSIEEEKKAREHFKKELGRAEELTSQQQSFYTEHTQLIERELDEALQENIVHAEQIKKSANISMLYEASQLLTAGVTMFGDSPNYYIGQLIPSVEAVGVEAYHLYQTFKETGSYSQRATQILGSSLTILGNAFIGYAGTVAAANNDWKEWGYGVNITAPEYTNNTFFNPAYSGVSLTSWTAFGVGTLSLIGGHLIKLRGVHTIANAKKKDYESKL
ncbi:eCIS core domain-containing protein [Undibacterium terreum]|uniref:eCIS core domain-containing protein n=1 Tax=Undibacterium terreum TaxID=1224302 RepID=A0A916U8Y9_9BURK|nr:DUF4157 domain-containing protein [Undibacterium terreum]GGC64641.1 hypothetical protein GCM10011396_09550 [Undibacterium terreum]